jgi:hypothetical protein
MAKKKSNPFAMVVRSAPRAPKMPNIIVRAPAAAKKHKGGHRRSVGKGSMQKRVVAAGVGGAALGFLEKQFPNLPVVPLLGKKGVILIGAFFLAKQKGTMGTIAADVAVATAAIAGYELGSTGKVTGLAAQI